MRPTTPTLVPFDGVPKFWLYTQSVPDPSSILKKPNPSAPIDSTTRPPTAISRPAYRAGSRLMAAMLSRGGQAVNTSIQALSARTAATKRLRLTVCSSDLFLRRSVARARALLPGKPHPGKDAANCPGVLSLLLGAILGP